MSTVTWLALLNLTLQCIDSVFFHKKHHPIIAINLILLCIAEIIFDKSAYLFLGLFIGFVFLAIQNKFKK